MLNHKYGGRLSYRRRQVFNQIEYNISNTIPHENNENPYESAHSRSLIWTLLSAGNTLLLWKLSADSKVQLRSHGCGVETTHTFRCIFLTDSEFQIRLRGCAGSYGYSLF